MRRLVVCVFLFFIFFGGLSTAQFPVYAQPVPIQEVKPVQTIEQESKPQQSGNILAQLGNAWDKFRASWVDQLQHAAATAYKLGLRRFLQNMAYETATWVASGGKGQKPLFITQG